MCLCLCRTKLSDLKPLEAYLACSLIPLDKNPGLRLIGIGEVLRRIVGKAITTVLKPDLKEAVDGVQMCMIQEGGAEATIYSMVDIFSESSTQAIIQVYAVNAFNVKGSVEKTSPSILCIKSIILCVCSKYLR